MKRKPVRYAMPEARLPVNALAFAYGLYLVFLMPSALSGQLLSDEGTMYGMAARTCRALLTADRHSPEPVLTNDVDGFVAAYIPAFVQGYHFGLSATAFGFHRLLSPVPSGERFGVLFRFAQQVFLEELTPADTRQALMQVGAGLERLYEQYSRQQRRAVDGRGYGAGTDRSALLH